MSETRIGVKWLKGRNHVEPEYVRIVILDGTLEPPKRLVSIAEPDVRHGKVQPGGE